MPGPAPKDPSVRARRNKTSTAAVLTTKRRGRPPSLPPATGELGWHPQTQAWWKDVWGSPMAPEYDDSDRHGLNMLAVLVNDYWFAESSRERMQLLGEVRQQSQRYGLSPIDRRRLQWEIERTDEAQQKGTRRRAAAATKKPAGGADPRAVLRAI